MKKAKITLAILSALIVSVSFNSGISAISAPVQKQSAAKVTDKTTIQRETSKILSIYNKVLCGTSSYTMKQTVLVNNKADGSSQVIYNAKSDDYLVYNSKSGDHETKPTLLRGWNKANRSVYCLYDDQWAFMYQQQNPNESKKIMNQYAQLSKTGYIYKTNKGYKLQMKDKEYSYVLEYENNNKIREVVIDSEDDIIQVTSEYTFCDDSKAIINYRNLK